MNFYEHHLGDYMRDTAHLSMIEDAAYRRLLDAYYIRGAPLPADLRDCCKLARAHSKVERDAVAYVLREFFDLRDDGHHQDRADREIARYLEKQPEAQRKRENAAERQRRAREHRKELFDQLRDKGIVPKYDSTTSELQELLSRADNAPRRAPVTRDNTATSPQSPVPSPQEIPETVETPVDDNPRAPPAGADVGGSPLHGATRAGWLCKRLRSMGVASVNPANPRLLTLLDAGATDAEFTAMVPASQGKGDPFAYILGAVEGERRRAKATAGAIHRGAMPNKQEAIEVSNRAVAMDWVAEMRGRK